MNDEDIKMDVNKKHNLRDILYNPVPLKILSFFSLNSADNFLASEISKAVSASKGATHQALQLLIEFEIVMRHAKGNLFLYKVNEDSPVLKNFKMFENFLSLQPLLKKLKPHAYQIILFGSCASGDNTEHSDIDLFVKTEEKDKVEKIINKFTQEGKRINAALYDSLEAVSLQKEDKHFFEQIKKGIILWEGKPEHEE
jgi:predicted nucleotidyltransferase